MPAFDGGEAPVPHLKLVALPYDRDSVLASLEAGAPARPHTRELDSLFALWREPFVAYSRATFFAGKYRAALARLRLQLDSLPRGAPEYASLYRQFGELTDSLAAAESLAAPAGKELERRRASLLPRIDSLRREVSAWENSTFRDYESRVKDLAGTREPLAGETGADGRATLKLSPGRWWIYAWVWDEGDPYSRWYWNVPVTGDSVILDSRTGRRKPQY